MKRVGILVGHYGEDTGANSGRRDEWELAYADAIQLAQLLDQENKLLPVFIHIDRREHPWDLVQSVSKISPPSFLGGWGNIDVRVQWALRDKVDAAVEFHVNSSKGTAAGHEVFIRRSPGPNTRKLGQLLINELDLVLENDRRGLKHKSFRVLRKLHAFNIPAAILEPAFITESRWESEQWRDKYVGAVKTALYRFFNVQEATHG